MNLSIAWLLIILNSPTPTVLVVTNEAECRDFQKTINLYVPEWAAACRPLKG